MSNRLAEILSKSKAVMQKAEQEYVPPTFFFILYRLRDEMEQAHKYLKMACENMDIYLPYFLL